MKGLARWEEVEPVEMIDMLAGTGAGEPGSAGHLAYSALNAHVLQATQTVYHRANFQDSRLLQPSSALRRDFRENARLYKLPPTSIPARRSWKSLSTAVSPRIRTLPRLPLRPSHKLLRLPNSYRPPMIPRIHPHVVGLRKEAPVDDLRVILKNNDGVIYRQIL
ncbi:hypothetical protein EV421DRAFT_1903198 [Armillaria borealis]|uniref:Uncharacterized protein n=1 Tax=Armillaria borealis TaxID=47425 RepID=A0AA39MSD9_9AGAR|nr:hypothetical protein EV421DRAFT_1903198 [Armillaria borealis]